MFPFSFRPFVNDKKNILLDRPVYLPPQRGQTAGSSPRWAFSVSWQDAGSRLCFHCACVYSALSMLVSDAGFLLILMILKSLLIIYTLPWREKLKQKREADIDKMIIKTENNWGLGHISLTLGTKFRIHSLCHSPVFRLWTSPLISPDLEYFYH